jgi:hypothetical protein
LIEERADGITILQVLPLGPGRSLLRRHEFTRCASPRAARAAPYLASRRSRVSRRFAIDVAETAQRGIATVRHDRFGGASAELDSPHSPDSPALAALAAFRRELIALVPVLALSRAPSDA